MRRSVAVEHLEANAFVGLALVLGRVQITKVENKGKANKRVRLQVLDHD